MVPRSSSISLLAMMSSSLLRRTKSGSVPSRTRARLMERTSSERSSFSRLMTARPVKASGSRPPAFSTSWRTVFSSSLRSYMPGKKTAPLTETLFSKRDCSRPTVTSSPFCRTKLVKSRFSTVRTSKDFPFCRTTLTLSVLAPLVKPPAYEIKCATVSPSFISKNIGRMIIPLILTISVYGRTRMTSPSSRRTSFSRLPVVRSSYTSACPIILPPRETVMLRSDPGSTMPPA